MTDASQSDKSEQDQEPMKVLLVDDYPENLSVLEFVLRRLNVTCIQAEDGDQAIAQCSEQVFGLIFLDYFRNQRNQQTAC
jgi:CheY-like chemotaxis protein